MPTSFQVTHTNALDILALGDSIVIDLGYGRIARGQVSVLARNISGDIDLAVPGHGFRLSAPGTRHGGHFSLNVTKA